MDITLFWKWSPKHLHSDDTEIKTLVRWLRCCKTSLCFNYTFKRKGFVPVTFSWCTIHVHTLLLLWRIRTTQNCNNCCHCCCFSYLFFILQLYIVLYFHLIDIDFYSKKRYYSYFFQNNNLNLFADQNFDITYWGTFWQNYLTSWSHCFDQKKLHIHINKFSHKVIFLT